MKTVAEIEELKSFRNEVAVKAMEKFIETKNYDWHRDLAKDSFGIAQEMVKARLESDKYKYTL